MQEKCTNRYKQLFGRLEANGLLYMNNPLDLWCLHFAFIPQLNAALKTFADGWNWHPISTAGHQSPRKLWVKSESQPWTDLTPDTMQANKRGIKLSTGDEWISRMEQLDEHYREQLPMSFAEYGLDDYGRRSEGQAKDTDPYVHVDPVLKDVGWDVVQALEAPAFREWLELEIGPAYPPAQDDGEARYCRCRELIDSFVRQNFPWYVSAEYK